ncbi:HAMP domain-containing histidine kinase [Paenibacillus sp. TRM 82003]|uniref:sensor histidine kinase n=1 Tax=Kineococcus sp. TRM81007 TaxID=2925831 RepID=UPI001F55DFE7|nr:ATP-binding protein [Kineococcus sp. TRM81007]MCI2238996.1 HAMP domain-containing histidine kinase [Kineococcus sp. TRM81007]MCI3924416.1 HAMP domain-containing histidine kinase [Paenibacillus sp. TRM 82003]
MRFPLRRPQTLRGRLIATVTSLLVAVGLVIGVVTTYALSEQLVDQVDGQLAESVELAQRSEFGGRGGPPPDEEEASACPSGTRPAFVGPGQVDGTLGARFAGGQLVAGQSGVIDTSSTGSQECAVALSDAQAEVLRQVELGGARTVELPGLGTYRVVAATLPTGALQVTGVPLTGVETTLWTVVGVEAAVILLGVAAAAVTGTVLVRRDLAPLQRVAATAARVSELELDRGEVDLEQRVPEADTDERTEVGRVGSALNRLLDHVGSALRARHASEQRVRQFVADASHELRTPLAAIRGYAELARRNRESVPADVAHALRRVESEAVRMTGLVEDLLLLARLDSGRPLERESVDLTMTVLDAVSDARVAGPEHTWRLDLPEEAVEVPGDAARLHQVLVNLLANARSHTPPGTTVTVHLAADPAPGGAGRVHLDVVDDGPGIAPDLLPHVFERFARGDSSRSRAAGSTGLGLAIVQAVVASHHGEVAVDSRPGRTAFRVSLPAVGAAPPAPAG